MKLRKIRNLALLGMALLFALPVGSTWAEDSCFLGFGRIQNGFYRIARHYEREGEFWNRYVRHVVRNRRARREAARAEQLPWLVRVDNSFGSFRDAMVDRLPISRSSASNYGRALREQPFQTVGGTGLNLARGVWDVGSFAPRVVLSAVGDLGRYMGKGLKEWWQSPGIIRKGVRTIIRPRDDLRGQGFIARVGDFAQDPLSAGLQSRLIRRGVQSLTGLQVPRPRYMATMVSSMGVYGTAAYYLAWKPLSESNRRECVEILEMGRSRATLGMEHLDSWIAAQIFSDPCEYAGILRNHAATISDWRRGEIEVYPALMDYLQAGLFGEITSEEFDHIKVVVDLLNQKAATNAEIEAAAAKLTDKERFLFYRLSSANELLLKTLADTFLESRALDKEILAGVKDRSEHVPFETMFQQKWEAALAKSDVLGDLMGNDSAKRHLLGVFNPRVEIEGKTDFEWIRLAETNGEGQKLSDLMQIAVNGASESLSSMRSQGSPHPLHHTWVVEMLVKSQTEVKDYERFSRREEVSQAELSQLEANISGIDLRLASNNISTAERARLAQSKDELSGKLIQLERRIERLQRIRLAEDKIHQRILAAKEIPEFCAQANCEDKLPSLVRAELPPFTVGQSFFAFSTDPTAKPRTLSSEIDYMKLAYEDPIFIEFAVEKAQGKSNDADLLARLSRQIEGYSELFKLQAGVFKEASFEIGELSEIEEIPKPHPSLVCSLFGDVKVDGKPTRPNHLFAGVGARLNQEQGNLSKRRFDACRYLIGGTLWEFYAIEGAISRRMRQQIAALDAKFERGSMAYNAEFERIRAIHQTMIIRSRQDLVIESGEGTYWLLDQLIAACRDPAFTIPEEMKAEDLACETYDLNFSRVPAGKN